MTLEETYRMLYSAYLGVSEMDEYSSKEFVLKEIEDYINDFVTQHNLNLDFQGIKNELEKQDMIRKLQDAVIVLNMIKAPLELILLIRHKLSDFGV